MPETPPRLPFDIDEAIDQIFSTPALRRMGTHQMKLGGRPDGCQWRIHCRGFIPGVQLRRYFMLSRMVNP